ncbi:hypothetical protein RIF29_18666 [Crotalaria pallida]|uniref:Uncharacterized protein n=1 Tax=Crotalaria pallida TaxID=3830 RepID=A0AAN9EY16_CROPI
MQRTTMMINNNGEEEEKKFWKNRFEQRSLGVGREKKGIKRSSEPIFSAPNDIRNRVSTIHNIKKNIACPTVMVAAGS